MISTFVAQVDRGCAWACASNRDEYLIATETLLDGLAENYGFTEAGASLKSARQRIKAMVKAKEAATCEYVEPERRDAAINFVVDAFNGKVDSVIADAKADNFGTLRQRIVDAYALVNMNGRAFRNAKIYKGYCDARLEELRLGAILLELREARAAAMISPLHSCVPWLSNPTSEEPGRELVMPRRRASTSAAHAVPSSILPRKNLIGLRAMRERRS